jgi:hypothetical protein
MRPLLAAVFLLAACEDDTSSPALPCGPQRLEVVIDPLQAEVEAAGKRMIDCSNLDMNAAADCVETAQAAGDGFRVTWNAAAEITAIYVGVPGEGGHRVLKLADWYDFQRGTLDWQVTCDSFTRKPTCDEVDHDDYCFVCESSQPDLVLCDDREELP